MMRGEARGAILHVCLKHLRRHPLEVDLPVSVLTDLLAYDSLIAEAEQGANGTGE